MLFVIHKKLRSICSGMLAGAAALCPVASASPGGTHPQWGDLRKGPYEVGFRVLNRYDDERGHRSKVDFRGNRRSGELGRPIQISLWYPAQADDSAVFMRYREYVDLIASQTTFEEPAPEALQANLKHFKAGPISRDVTEEQLKDLFATETAAVRGAAPAPGRFSLIVFAQGSDGSPVEHSILAEYLASHGYVFATSPSSRRISRQRGQIEAQIRDMEFVTAAVRELPFVDKERLVIAAYSLGGASGLMYQVRNMRADAVISLDGVEGFGAFKRLTEMTGYETAAFRVPFLYISQDPEVAEEYGWKRDMDWLDDLPYSERYLLIFFNSRHYDFTSFGMLESEIPRFHFEEEGRSRVNNQELYQAMVRYVLMFCDAWTEGDARAREFLRRSPEDNGLPAGSAEMKLMPAAPAIPTSSEVTAMLLEEGGAATVAEIYRELKARSPRTEIFTESSLTRLGSRLTEIAEAGKAVAIFNLAKEAFPDSANVYGLLGDAYRQLGDVESSIRAYETALEKLAGDVTLSEERKKTLESKVSAGLDRLRDVREGAR